MRHSWHLLSVKLHVMDGSPESLRLENENAKLTQLGNRGWDQDLSAPMRQDVDTGPACGFSGSRHLDTAQLPACTVVCTHALKG